MVGITTEIQTVENWSDLLIHGLVELGADYFCLSPGKRCAPLALAASRNERAEVFVHFDERGSAFHALGASKASKKPAVIITTSGTAVGNLMPAVMESSLSRVPLILLTADRPPELRDTMANQACDQVKIFGDYVHYFVDLPCPTLEVPETFLITTLLTAYTHALTGPVHINCPFREPLYARIH